VDLLTFYMGKNTPDRQVFIIDNLRVEKDLALDDPKTELEEVDAEVDA
jgi:topoisomerase-4 subunit B